MHRCTLCGIYPFCKNINEEKIGIENNCETFIRRSLMCDVQVNKGCQFKTGKEDSKKSEC